MFLIKVRRLVDMTKLSDGAWQDDAFPVDTEVYLGPKFIEASKTFELLSANNIWRDGVESIEFLHQINPGEKPARLALMTRNGEA